MLDGAGAEEGQVAERCLRWEGGLGAVDGEEEVLEVAAPGRGELGRFLGMIGVLGVCWVWWV